METVRIYHLNGLTPAMRQRAAQMEAARVWTYCVGRQSCASVAVSGEPAASVHDAVGRRNRKDAPGPVGAEALLVRGEGSVTVLYSCRQTFYQ